MIDADVIDHLPDGRSEIDYDAFRARIPTWPAWLRVDGHDITWGPESDVVFHTRHSGRHFAIITPLNPSAASALHAELYGVVDTPLGFRWAPLQTDWGADAEELVEHARAMRRDLPGILTTCDLSRLGRDGELDAYDRRYEGSRLRWKAYYRWDENWDHDHCVYCDARLSLDEPDALKAGYAIQGGPHGDDYRWICGPCVDARRGLVSYVIEVAPEDG